MSNVVAFKPERLKPRAKPGPAPFELLFFTGVRYERHEEGEGAPKRRRLVRVKDKKQRRA